MNVAATSSIEPKVDSEWIPRYHSWKNKVYEDRSTHIPTPKQKHVLQTIHFRTVKEEYQMLSEPIPEHVWQEKPDNIYVEAPLLRLVHGLPGSGKSELLLWIKNYFEEVWMWEANNQFAITAPLNSMADNVGGSTLHSFGAIPFKDRRGVVVNASSFMDDEKQSLLSKSWHNLRVLLCDEIEAAGVDIIGKIDAAM